ncbi:MAG: hypothetical protein IM638_18355 [Bacteroidetes bacterium]|nr:hypothetical protein [Bacteroidota bacterium]
MRIAAMLLLLLTAVAAGAPSPTLLQVRNRFENASKGETLCESLLGMVRGHTVESNAVMHGYLGAGETIHAQFSANPYTKLSRFNSGKAKLEAAVTKQPQLMELRYLRFTVQCGAPSFLGYNTQLAADKKFLLEGLSQLSADDYDLYCRIAKYLEQSTQLSAAEKQQLAAILKVSPVKK